MKAKKPPWGDTFIAMIGHRDRTQINHLIRLALEEEIGKFLTMAFNDFGMEPAEVALYCSDLATWFQATAEQCQRIDSEKPSS